MKSNILLFVFFLLFSHLSFGQTIGDTNELQWDYPIKPGTPEWAAFKTGKEKYDACQIPLDVLNNMSTKELARVCLNYPLFITYQAYNDERSGVNILIKNFNGLWELSQRKDGMQELVKVYAEYPIFTRFEEDKIAIICKLLFLELVLSDNLFLSQLNHKQLQEFKAIVITKYAAKLQNLEVYHLFHIKKTMLLAAIIIDRQNHIEKTTQQQEHLKNFIKSYERCDASLVTEVSKIIVEL